MVRSGASDAAATVVYVSSHASTVTALVDRGSKGQADEACVLLKGLDTPSRWASASRCWSWTPGAAPCGTPRQEYWGRPAHLLLLPDGSLLVSDDFAGAVYRVTYKEGG
jgi:hypothetical protein